MSVKEELLARLQRARSEQAVLDEEIQELEQLLGIPSAPPRPRYEMRLDALQRAFKDGQPKSLRRAMSDVGFSETTAKTGKRWYVERLGLVRVSRGVYVLRSTDAPTRSEKDPRISDETGGAK